MEAKGTQHQERIVFCFAITNLIEKRQVTSCNKTSASDVIVHDSGLLCTQGQVVIIYIRDSLHSSRTVI